MQKDESRPDRVVGFAPSISPVVRGDRRGVPDGGCEHRMGGSRGGGQQDGIRSEIFAPIYWTTNRLPVWRSSS